MKNFDTKNLKMRIPFYFIGLFIMTVGIALSVKSDLGVSPVSSIPYTITRVCGIEMGNATIIFHLALILIQFVILAFKKEFRPQILLQIPVGIIFGKFTTFCNYLVSFIPSPENFFIRLLLSLLSCFFVAFGIFLYVPVNLIPLAGEGCMGVISEVTKIEFAKIKIAFDCSMVLISAVTCLVVLKNLGSVGLGTIIAAFLVGLILGFMIRKFGNVRDRLLGIVE